MKKSIPAILFALATTGMIAIAMVLIGGNALLNTNTVAVVNAASTNASTAQTSNVSATDQQIADLQARIQEYQQREQQYQTQLNTAAQRLNDANSQLDQANQSITAYQNILLQLQRRGVIRISADGQITLGSTNFN